MTDFQFDPGATNDPEENLHPYTMKPQTHGALDIHVLQISGQPMPAGAAMPVPKGPEPFTYTPKPVLHADEPQSLPDYPQSMKAKTATGGSVWYDYTHDKKPLAATVYDQSGQFESFHNPSEIAFPAFKTPVKGSSGLDQLDAEITKLLGPEKSTLHVGEPVTINTGPGVSSGKSEIKYNTPEGGKVYYYWHKNSGNADSADVYDKTGIYVKTYEAKDINFPGHPNFIQKSFAPTVHDTYSTAFAHYKNFDDDKPELEFAGPLESSAKDVAIGTLQNGNKIKIFYGVKGDPVVGNEETPAGAIVQQHNAEDVNLPQHPSEVPKPTLHTGPLISDLGQTLHASAPNGEHVYYDYGSGGKPLKAEVFGSDGTIKKTYQPDEINFPVFPGSKPSLAKVNLPENYPKEERIDELYNKPQEPITAYPKFSPKEPLTESEQNLISDYTGSFYHKIANHIYGHSPNPKLEPKIEAINKAIAKHPLAESVTLYRGLSYDNFQKFAGLKPGQTATYDGFMSTSSNRHLGSTWKNSGHHFVIEAPAGTPALPVAHMSQHESEKEVLLPTKTKLKFIKREGNALHFEVVPRTE